MDKHSKSVEDRKDALLEEGLEKLEQPPKGDFIVGLRNFIAWVKDLIEKE